MVIGVMLLGAACARAADPVSKRTSVFYPPETIRRARANAESYPWPAQTQRALIAAAQPWMELSDDELWDLMFGNTIKRAWMVWSDGHCPSCQKGVPMYNWQVDALSQPWKVRCPHCGELFPKNDFRQFYRSGLDEHGVFDPQRADRTLLFNAERPDPKDPLHLYGVDDGEGYVGDEGRWRFIGAYLVYGQWRQLVTNGIRDLASAYVATGDKAYAHKAAILLDRVADLYPTFDFSKQGVLYDGRASGAGYVTVWHDACEETRLLTLAYDQIFDGARTDGELVTFLARKAKQFALDNPKTSWEDIQRNIEERILRDALRNRHKIASNYPRTDYTIAAINAVLGWPDNRDEVCGILDAVVAKGTAVDGVTGEKGLANYSASAVRVMLEMLAQFSMLEPDFLSDMLQRHPALRLLPRFHIDTWCLGSYYPLSGDTGAFARKIDRYAVSLSGAVTGVAPSAHSLLWKLYELTGDVALVQVLYQANGGSADDLPHDLFADDPSAMQNAVRDVIARHGADRRLGSVNKQQWHLAILRAGEGDNARALWLDYDSGGGHGHADGMNLGLFAKGLDLMPDFGYPPVQFGGWGSPAASWYRSSAAHNTVVVDGTDLSSTVGETTLWADGKQFRAIRASGAKMIDAQRFERTAALVDISDRDSYVVDIFRVVGGTDHAKFLHSHFGEITTRGLAVEPSPEYGHGAIMRDFSCDPAPQPGWSVDWNVEDRYQILPPGSDVHLRCTDLTAGSRAIIAEGWVVAGSFDSIDEAWIPRVIVRRESNQPPLASTFVAVIEPYEGQPNIAQVLRRPLIAPDGTTCADPHVAVEVRMVDGRRDLLIAADAEDAQSLSPEGNGVPSLVQQDWRVRLDGEMCSIRLDAAGSVSRIALCKGRSVTVGDVMVKLRERAAFVEVSFEGGRAFVESGNAEAIDAILVDGRPTEWERS